MPEDAGALLVRSGLIASEHLRLARQAQAGSGGTIGEHLVMAGVIDDEALAEFYRVHLVVPQVQPELLTTIPAPLIAKIPAAMATGFRCVPVSCDRDRNLVLAMADPSTTHAVDEISFHTGHYIDRAVATQRQIAWCLVRYYGEITPLAKRLAFDQGEPEEQGQISFPLRDRSGSIPAGGSGYVPNARRRSARMPAALRIDGPPEGDAHDAASQGYSPPPPETLPLPAPTDITPTDHHVDGGFSSVPVVIESDRPSPRPAYIPPETKEPEISFLHDETSPTGPMRLINKRAQSIPELEARVGEVDVPSGPIPTLHEQLPPVMVSLENSGGVPTHDHSPTGPLPARVAAVPEPISSELATSSYGGDEERAAAPGRGDPDHHDHTRRAVGAADDPDGRGDEADGAAHTSLTAAFDDSTGSDEIILLQQKNESRRPHRRTRIGLGINPSTLQQLTGGPDSRHSAGAASDYDNAPTAPFGVPSEAYSGVSSAPLLSGESIQEAAHAAAEVYSRHSTQDSGRAVPRVVEDAAPPADSEPSAAPKRWRHRDDTPGPTTAPQRHAEDAEATDPEHAFDSVPDVLPHPDDPIASAPLDHQADPSIEALSYALDSGPAAPGYEPDPSVEALHHEFDDSEVEQLMNGGFAAPLAPSLPPDREHVLDYADSPPPPLSVVSPARAAEADADTDPSRPSQPRDPAAAVGDSARRAPTAPGSAMSFYGNEPRTPELIQALEESSLRLVSVLRQLEQAADRSEVVDTLLTHLSESYQRVAFFTVKAGDLTTWKQRLGQAPIERRDGIKLSLDEASTFQDIVGTRLPFHGPLNDPVSRAFVSAALGYSALEILALPVSVRGRVVGIVYGDTRAQRVFEQHLPVVTRAAGVALERILRARKHP
ncbi:MAG: hypothetical protein Tsb0020_27690 [Haliangiales bacterium]